MSYPFNTIFMYRLLKKKVKKLLYASSIFLGILHIILLLKNKTVCYVNTNK